nr:MAG TPA: hypothetical protein [Caudoviricetes sp.]
MFAPDVVRVWWGGRVWWNGGGLSWWTSALHCFDVVALRRLVVVVSGGMVRTIRRLLLAAL